MRRITVLDRILLLITALLAAYQIVKGVDDLVPLVIVSYTIAFGVLLVACLLLIILGFEILDSPLLVIVATIIPLSLSLGLVTEYLPTLTIVYLIFTFAGLSTIVITRFTTSDRIAVIVLAVVHGIAGVIIFGLPITLSLRGETPRGFTLVGVGGALIGMGGLALSFLKAGKPILSKETIMTILSGLLLLMTAAFVAGFVME